LLNGFAQIKDEIRYMTRSDKIEIYRWFGGEVAGDVSSKKANRSTALVKTVSLIFFTTEIVALKCVSRSRCG